MQSAPAETLIPAPTTDAAPDAKWPALCYCLAAALVSSGLLWACFHPLAWGAYLGWIALAPFFVLVRSQARPILVYLLAFLCGVAFFVPVLQWMSVADKMMVAAWLTLSVYCALYFPAALFCIRCLERWRFPLVISAPLVWVALEYVRCWAITGFPWYLLAHTQHDLLPMIQITDIGGVFLVSFVVVAVNALLFDIAYQFPEIRRWFNQTDLDPYRYYSSLEIVNRATAADWLIRRNLIVEAIALVTVLIGTYAYGQYRLGQNRFQEGPTVCVLQSNLDQRLREDNQERSVKVVTEHFMELTKRAAFNHQTRPDLLIWPETSYPRAWYEVSRDHPIGDVPPEWREAEIDVRHALSDLAELTQVPHLLGMSTQFLDAKGKPRRYNSAILLRPVTQPNGRIKGLIDTNKDKFDKIHRVPFGEFVPMVDWLPFLAWLTPYEGDFGLHQGDKMTRFEIGKLRFGVLICYEDTDPFMARRYLESSPEEPAIDFLVNISNDGWFAGSVEHEEHLAVSRFRAIECRRSMVRAVNMGVSAVIDSNGRILKPKLVPGTNPPVWLVEQGMTGGALELPAAQWHEFKKKHGILKATVPIDHRFSFYAAAGDWVPVGCCAILIGGGGWSLVRRRKSRLTTSPS